MHTTPLVWKGPEETINSDMIFFSSKRDWLRERKGLVGIVVIQ